MKTKLFKYQEKGVIQIDKFDGRALLADSMGLGKSIQALTWYAENPKARPTIIVCPAHLKWNWRREASIHINSPSEVLEGRKVPSQQLTKHHNLIIINYDILPNWLHFLRSLKPQLIILDEAQAIKNRNAKRTKAVQALCKGVPHIIAISGTPLENRPIELFPALNLIRPDVFSSFYEFAMAHCKPQRKPWGWVYNGATNLDKLNAKLKDTMMIRRLKKDVLKDLPDKTRSVIVVELPDMKEYKAAEKDFLVWLAKRHSKAKAKKAAQAERLTRLGYLKRLAGQLKTPLVEEWIAEFLEESPNEKLVVFGIHKVVMGVLKERFKDLCVVIDGSVSSVNRQKAVEAFQDSKQVRLFLGNIDAAGTGINLTKASTLLFAELSWVPGKHVQAEDRIHRIGQQNAASIFYLVARNTIEETLCKVLEEKQEVLNSVLDGSTEMADHLDIMSQVENAMLKGVRR